MSPLRWKLERLPNGYVRVEDRQSGLVNLLEADGKTRSGPSRLPAWVREAAIETARDGMVHYV